MRFLMLNWRDPHNPKSGGAERVSLAYLAALQKRGHDVAWFANEFPGCRREDLIGGIKVVRAGGSGGSILKARQWYRSQQRFNLVIDQHHGIPWFAPWWSGTHCVAYIHEVLGPIWKAFYRWPLSMAGRVQERWTHRLYRNVPFWTPSESTRKTLLSEGVRSVTVLPNGTDTEALASLDPKPFGPPVRLIAVSRLAPNKRVDHAILALQKLLERGRDAQLTIVGDGEVRGQLKQLAVDAGVGGRVRFAGAVDEPTKNLLLQEAHLLVHTSLREGWGLNVIEANAMGTPAIVYPVGGLVDSTVHDQTGIVTGSEDPASVADAVTALVAEPGKYDRLRRAAWERAKTFAWSRVLPPACDFLEKLAARHRS